MQNHLLFFLFEESLIKVSDRSETSVAMVVKGLGNSILTPMEKDFVYSCHRKRPILLTLNLTYCRVSDQLALLTLNLTYCRVSDQLALPQPDLLQGV